jgi:hypothetical protein
LQAADFFTQVAAHPCIECRKRLIEQQQAGRRGQGAGQGDALLLTARQLGRVFVGVLAQANQFQQFTYALVDGGLGQALTAQAEGDVGVHAEIGEQRIGLKHDAEVALARRQQGNIPLALQQTAAALRFEAGDDAQQGGLAAARGAKKAQQLTRLDIQVNIAQHLGGAEVLVDAVQLQTAAAALSHGQLPL